MSKFHRFWLPKSVQKSIKTAQKSEQKQDTKKEAKKSEKRDQHERPPPVNLTSRGKRKAQTKAVDIVLLAAVC